MTLLRRVGTGFEPEGQPGPETGQPSPSAVAADDGLEPAPAEC
jgi:hypothetical protein